MRAIYKIINAVNNKFYVGSAVNYEKRKARHVWRLRRGDHANKHLQAAWNLYGEKVFVFAIVQHVSENEDLLAAENVWLHEHVGKGYCYNIATDATAPTRGWYGVKNPMWGKTFSHTAIAKEKISAASKTRVQSREEKAKRRESMKGHAVPTDVRAKISAALSGDKNPNYGKPRSEAFCNKVRKAVHATGPQVDTVYPSVQAAREALNMTPPTINRALKSGQPITRGKFTGWVFKYVDPTQNP